MMLSLCCGGRTANAEQRAVAATGSSLRIRHAWCTGARVHENCVPPKCCLIMSINRMIRYCIRVHLCQDCVNFGLTFQTDVLG